MEDQHKHSDTARKDARMETDFPDLCNGAEDHPVCDIRNPRPNYLLRRADYVKNAQTNTCRSYCKEQRQRALLFDLKVEAIHPS